MDSIRPFIFPALVLAFVGTGLFRAVFPARHLIGIRSRELRKAGKADEARALTARDRCESIQPADAPRLKRIRLFGAVRVLIGGLLLAKMGLAIGWIGHDFAKTSAGAAPELESRIEETCAPFLREGKSVGMVIAAIVGTNRVLVGLGRPAVFGSDRVREDTLFEIGSITKTFTGIALAKAVHQRKLRLEQRVVDLLPGGVALPEGARPVTLQQLTTHTAGFPRLPGRPRIISALNMQLFGGDPYAGLDEKRFRDGLRRLQLRSEPGKEFEYSNFGTGLLGWVLAGQAGTNYDAFIRREVCLPLGMTNTSVALSRNQAGRFAQGYRATFKFGPLLLSLRSSPWHLSDPLAGAGGLRSSGADMLKFLEANMRPAGTPLSEALGKSHRELFRSSERHAVGMNWLRRKSGRLGQTTIWHNGGTGGFHSFLAFTEDGTVGVLILSNVSRSVDERGMALLRGLAG